MVRSIIAFVWSLTAVTLNSELTQIEFVVSIPDDTPKDASVYLAGDCSALGDWKAEGLKLTRSEDGRYRGQAKLPQNATIAFKVTRGVWDLVERDAEGRDIPNRTFVVSEQAKVKIRVLRWATGETSSNRPSTLTGDIRHHHGFASKHLKNKRTLIVYLPPEYEKAKQTRYPVLYMHDGQNIFDCATSFAGVEWQADEHAERLIREGRITPLIIVGIYNNSQRADEYSPYRDDVRGNGGRGDFYARFVVEEVKPFIDKTYLTRPEREHSAIAGSSLGGLISLHICRRSPETFSKCGVISPALMWDKRHILRDCAADMAWIKRTQFWLDMGTAEGEDIDRFHEGIDCTRQLVRIFKRAGLSADRDFRYMETPGGRHHEADWAARFDKTLLYFYGVKKPTPNKTPQEDAATMTADANANKA